jgi:hypothetical protein
MSEHPIERCPECEALDQGQSLDRRDFFRVLGGTAAVAGTAGLLPAVARAADSAPVKRPTKPAEDLIKELYSTLNDTQKKTVVLPWDDGPKNGIPTRMGMYNAPIKGQKIGALYSKAQQELLNKIVRSLISEEEQSYGRISRNGTWDNSGSFENCGAHIFGNPLEGQKYAWVFAGHHLTLRCDGDSLEGAAWGGPIYYGHSPNGYSDKNVWYYQTEKALEVFKSLGKKQQEVAIVGGSPGEQAGSVRFRKPEQTKPGIACSELTSEQKALVEIVIKSVLSPYRKQDAEEVLQILRANGGLEKLHLAFYKDDKMNDNERWHFWRLEGPGFVWNYRILPHVHCFVNIAAAMA